MDKKPPVNKKGEEHMATQMQATPVLYGKDAEAVLEQIKKKPSAKQREKAKQRREFFKNIEKRGLR